MSKSTTFILNRFCYSCPRKPKIWRRNGIVSVNEKRVVTKDNKNKWESRSIESSGEHTLYPLSNKDSYLITLFKWPRADNARRNEIPVRRF